MIFRGVQKPSKDLSNKGEVTILYALFAFIIILIFTLASLWIKKNILYQQQLIRAKSCMLNLSYLHIDYVKAIENGNKIIILGNLSNFFPNTRIISKNIIKITQFAQEVKYLLYLFSLSKKNDCRATEKYHFMNSYPFIRKGALFKREKIGIVKKQKSSYAINICFVEARIYLVNKFKIKTLGISHKWKARDTVFCPQLL
jgi:hypothetical protein